MDRATTSSKDERDGPVRRHTAPATSTKGGIRVMEKELFGVFDDRSAFERARSPESFDRLCSTDALTVGIRDPALGVPGRSAAYDGPEGACVIWGEAYLPEEAQDDPARWVLRRYAEVGTNALYRLNGSYLLAIAHDGEAAVYTDPIRSWECFYTDASGVRTFGTDAERVCRTVPTLSLDRESMLELAHLSIILDDRTLFKEVERAPFDGVLFADETDSLERFVYRPRRFDYATELAARLRRALDRRASLPGRKGLLLGAGYDSRALLAGIPGIECCYTVGAESAPEVRVARKISNQYGASHRRIPIDGSYFDVGADVVRYTNGIGESIHVHQRGIESIADADVIYHGWAMDSLLKGFFIPKRRVGAFGKSVKLSSLDEDPDVVDFLSQRRLGIMPECDHLLADCPAVGDPAEFVRECLEHELDQCRDRCERIHDLSNVLGIKNLPSRSFRIHLADRFIESFLCADRELLEWHLQTPPEHRTTETFLDAVRQLDPDILQYRPPDRPRTNSVINQVEGFVRRNLRGMKAFGNPWPDRRDIYRRYGLDDVLFPDSPEIHSCSVRYKLRVHDVVTWLDALADERPIDPEEVGCPPADRRIRPGRPFESERPP